MLDLKNTVIGMEFIVSGRELQMSDHWDGLIRHQFERTARQVSQMIRDKSDTQKAYEQFDMIVRVRIEPHRMPYQPPISVSQDLNDTWNLLESWRMGNEGNRSFGLEQCPVIGENVYLAESGSMQSLSISRNKRSWYSTATSAIDKWRIKFLEPAEKK